MKKLALKFDEELPVDQPPVFQLGIDSEPREGHQYEGTYDYTISLDKEKYGPAEAVTRMLELVRARNLVVAGNMFTTGRHYCLRVRDRK